MAKQTRPPVVTVMGHVDHGKTSLLDAIRHTSVATGEKGGITQHIGAYQVDHSGKKITFIDTPGHAAFTKMRSRGAKVTDIVVLVVAASEGVKPQTIESIQHILSSKVQPIVALTKMDLPDADSEKIKAQLTEHELFVEGYGGDVVTVEVSAKTGKGIDKLLEMILLIAELKELTADPDGDFQAVVIESRKDSHKGSVATILVQDGSLRTTDKVFAENTEAKIRAMFDFEGKKVDSAGPAVPVETLGWKKIPGVGSIVTAKKLDEKQEQSVKRAEKKLETLVDNQKLAKIRLIIKSDTTGTLEAIEQSLPEEVELISAGVGDITENDILLAEAAHAKIIGFTVKVSGSTKKLAESHKVAVKIYAVIYEFLEELQKQVLKLLEPTIDEEELGVAEISTLFEMKGNKIAGCKVKSGEISKIQKYHLRREGNIIADPVVSSLKRGKEDIETAKTGTECGIVFRRFTDFQVGDELVAYRMKQE